jgi:hypothetical protein
MLLLQGLLLLLLLSTLLLMDPMCHCHAQCLMQLCPLW